jgi:hypothetical protein
MRAHRRGRGMDLQHATYGHQTSLRATEVRLPQRPRYPAAKKSGFPGDAIRVSCVVFCLTAPAATSIHGMLPGMM